MSSRKKGARNQRTAIDMEKANLNKKQAKDVSKTWQLQKKHLDSDIKQMSVMHKSVLGNLDVETSRMKVQAEKLMKQQLRLAEDDNPQEQTLRAELGLERRRSSINTQEVLNAAQALGLPSFENGRRSSFSGVETLSPSVGRGRRRSSVRVIGDGENMNANELEKLRKKSTQGTAKRGSLAREQCRSAAPRRNARFSTQPDTVDTTDSDDDYIEIPAITISAPDDYNNSPMTSPGSDNKGTSNPLESHTNQHHANEKTATLYSPKDATRKGGSRRCSRQQLESANLKSGRKSISSLSKSPMGRRKSSAAVVGNQFFPSPDVNQNRRASISRRKSTQLRARTEKELKHPHIKLEASGSDSEGSQHEHEESTELKNQLEAIENCRYLRRKSDDDRELTIAEIFAKD